MELFLKFKINLIIKFCCFSYLARNVDIACPECLQLIETTPVTRQQQDSNSISLHLLVQKDCGGLVYPSDFTIRLVTAAEKLSSVWMKTAEWWAAKPWSTENHWWTSPGAHPTLYGHSEQFQNICKFHAAKRFKEALHPKKAESNVIGSQYSAVAAKRRPADCRPPADQELIHRNLFLRWKVLWLSPHIKWEDNSEIYFRPLTKTGS